MLRIAPVGSFAGRVFGRVFAGLPAYVERIDPDPRGLPRFDADLIVRPRGDFALESALRSAQASGTIPILPEAVWSEPPEPDRIEAAIQAGLTDHFGFVVGRTDALHEACRWIRSAAHPMAYLISAATLVVGETGTGKELVARAVRRLGRGDSRPLVSVNCAAVEPSLGRSEFFGHVRGAFTDAVKDRAGVLSRSGDGVLFIDEISELPLDLQAGLLRVVEERSFVPVGGEIPQAFRAQLISATRRDLAELVREGRFRDDLRYRIAQIEIRLPPLRDRLADLPLLLTHFLSLHDLPSDLVDDDSLKALREHDWPGNIRELWSALSRLALLRKTGRSSKDAPWLALQDAPKAPDAPGSGTLDELRDRFEQGVVKAALERHRGDTALVAKELGVSRRTVYNLIRRLGLASSAERPRDS